MLTCDSDDVKMLKRWTCVES